MLATTADYFDIFESQGLDPEPSDETSAARYQYRTFDRRPGTRCRSRSTPTASQIGRSGRTALIVDGRTMAAVTYVVMGDLIQQRVTGRITRSPLRCCRSRRLR